MFLIPSCLQIVLEVSNRKVPDGDPVSPIPCWQQFLDAEKQSLLWLCAAVPHPLEAELSALQSKSPAGFKAQQEAQFHSFANPLKSQLRTTHSSAALGPDFAEVLSQVRGLATEEASMILLKCVVKTAMLLKNKLFHANTFRI